MTTHLSKSVRIDINMKTQAFDDNGNEIFMTTAIIVSPIKYVNEAVIIASNYVKSIEGAIDWQPEIMLPFSLSFDGSQPVTHRMCVREVYDNQIAMMVMAIGKMHGFDWCAQREYTLDDDITRHFCVIRCSIEQFLNKTGLKQID